MKKNALTFKIFLLIVINDLGDTLAQLIMKKGLVQTGISAITFENILEFAFKNLSSPVVWLGVIIYALNFFTWIVILYKVDLSVAMPVGSTSYIFIPICAMVFFHEKVDLLRWLGIAAIVLGVHFVSQSKPSEKQGGKTC